MQGHKSRTGDAPSSSSRKNEASASVCCAATLTGSMATCSKAAHSTQSTTDAVEATGALLERWPAARHGLLCDVLLDLMPA